MTKKFLISWFYNYQLSSPADSIPKPGMQVFVAVVPGRISVDFSSYIRSFLVALFEKRQGEININTAKNRHFLFFMLQAYRLFNVKTKEKTSLRQ